MEGGGKVARVHHSQDVPHLQVLPGRVEWKVNLDNNLNITHVNCLGIQITLKDLIENVCENVSVAWQGCPSILLLLSLACSLFLRG